MRTEIDLNEFEHFLRVNLYQTSISAWFIFHWNEVAFDFESEI